MYGDTNVCFNKSVMGRNRPATYGLHSFGTLFVPFLLKLCSTLTGATRVILLSEPPGMAANREFPPFSCRKKQRGKRRRSKRKMRKRRRRRRGRRERERRNRRQEIKKGEADRNTTLDTELPSLLK